MLRQTRLVDVQHVRSFYLVSSMLRLPAWHDRTPALSPGALETHPSLVHPADVLFWEVDKVKGYFDASEMHLASRQVILPTSTWSVYELGDLGRNPGLEPRRNQSDSHVPLGSPRPTTTRRCWGTNSQGKEVCTSRKRNDTTQNMSGTTPPSSNVFAPTH